MTEQQQKLLDNVFPQEYQDIMSDKCKELFCNAFILILKHFPDKDDLGYRSRVDNARKHAIKRLFPRLKDIKQPYALCPLNKLKVIIVLPEPYNNGESTGVPLSLIKFNSEEYNLYTPLFRLPINQQNVDCIEQYVGLNFDDSPFYRRIKFENLLSNGVLFIHSSITSEQNEELAHFKEWYQFTKEFICNLKDYNPNLIVATIGEILQKTLALDLPFKVIDAPNAFYTTQDRVSFRKFKLFEKINEELEKLGLEQITINQFYESILQEGVSHEQSEGDNLLS